MRVAIPFVAGVLFALGLCLSGMTDPAKIQNFLDVSGAWDPSLAFVMGGAILTHVGFARWALHAKKPYFAEEFAWPDLTRVDARLVIGAALFGIGWGLSGYCPGPAILSVVHPSRALYAFLLTMAVSTFVTRKILQREEHAETPRDPALSRS